MYKGALITESVPGFFCSFLGGRYVALGMEQPFFFLFGSDLGIIEV